MEKVKKCSLSLQIYFKLPICHRNWITVQGQCLCILTFTFKIKIEWPGSFWEKDCFMALRCTLTKLNFGFPLFACWPCVKSVLITPIITEGWPRKKCIVSKIYQLYGIGSSTFLCHPLNSGLLWGGGRHTKFVDKAEK